MTQTINLSTAHKIWSLLTSAERRRALVLLGLMFIGMVLETLGVGMVIPALGLLTHSDVVRNFPLLPSVIQTLGNPSQKTLIIGGMLLLVGVYLVKTLFLAFLSWWQTRFVYDAQAQLSQRLFTVYLHQPYTFHLQRNSAQLIRNVISEVSLFAGNGLMSGILLLSELLVLLGLCSLLFIVEPLGTVIVLSVLGPAAWVFYRLTRSNVARWGAARQYHEGLRIQHLQEGLGGAKDVKLLGREIEFLSKYDWHNVQSARMGQLQTTMQQLPRLWLEFLAVSGLAIMVISMLTQGRTLESVVPTLGMFAAAAFRLMPSVNRVLGSMQALRFVQPVIDSLYTEIKLVSPEVISTVSPRYVFQVALELSHITYSYPNAVQPALKDASLVIQSGESVGFIGTSGAGKSTLVDILLGLLTPDVGTVRIDGKDIQENLRNWQDQVGYVPQTIYLTDDTLRRNVAFGLPDEEIDETAVHRAIKAAQLEDFLANLPDGLETLVGERGVRLSGGQRQRIGIARALYHDPALLVLDEATSSLDTATEHDVMQAVRALQGTKTIIIIAHRLSTVAHCDRLYRLERGRGVEEGAPDNMSAS
ncbi:MAG: ATPase [Gallionellales bacterium RIFCSPHIGHO2_02_FULL_57_16]|nr:MAG: ATPase [Gallionellales bacterium RIFCSPHIGHO2_02_FULL_57_16]